MALTHITVGVLCLLTVAFAKQCIEDLGEKQCDKTSGSDCGPGTTCLELPIGQSGNTKAVCGPPQGAGCPCDKDMLAEETCTDGLTCQATKCNKKGCKYECLEPTDEEKRYMCDDSKKWRLVYKHDANGVPLAGYEDGHQTLIDLVRGGAEIKVKTNIGFYTVQKATLAPDGSAVFAQSLFYPIFFPNNVRLVVNLYQIASSTGDVHLTSLWPGYPEGETQPGGRPVYSNTNSKRALSWFVRESGVPVDDKAALGKQIERGSSVWYAWQRALLPLEAVSFSQQTGEVSGSTPWQMNDTLDGFQFFTTEAFEFRVIDGDLMTVSRVKANTEIMNETFTKDISDAEWFADPCSVPVYRHDENGNRLSGSLAALTTAVRSGKRITIAIDGVFYKTTMLTVSGTDSSVTAQVYDALATGDDSLASGEPAWKWVEASTSGETRVIIQQVGLPNANTMTSQSRGIAWFAESRDWTLTFQTALDNTVISGSLEDLKNAYNAGADVRYGLTRTDGGETEIMQADSILDHPRLPLWVYFGRKLQVDVNGTDVSVKRYDTITYLNTGKQVQNGIEAEGKYESGVTDDVAITWWTSPTSP